MLARETCWSGRAGGARGVRRAKTSRTCRTVYELVCRHGPILFAAWGRKGLGCDHGCMCIACDAAVLWTPRGLWDRGYRPVEGEAGVVQRHCASMQG